MSKKHRLENIFSLKWYYFKVKLFDLIVTDIDNFYLVRRHNDVETRVMFFHLISIELRFIEEDIVLHHYLIERRKKTPIGEYSGNTHARNDLKR